MWILYDLYGVASSMHSNWAGNKLQMQGDRLLKFSIVPCAGLVTMVAAFYTAMVGIRASKIIHHQLLDRIIKCPLSVFERIPRGRLMNRFSSDMVTVDYVMPFSYRSMVNCILNLIVTIVVIGLAVPWFLLVVLVTAVPYIMIQVCM